jgi:hypothetical protein
MWTESCSVPAAPVARLVHTPQKERLQRWYDIVWGKTQTTPKENTYATRH